MDQITLTAVQGKVGGMNLPPAPGNDRRAVPRHIRDAEHDAWRDVPAGPENQETAGRRARLWIYLAAIAALGLGLLYFLATRP